MLLLALLSLDESARPADPCGDLITESGLNITTEDGRFFLATECAIPEPEQTIFPGRTYRGKYPYWVPYKKSPLPYQIADEDEEAALAEVWMEIDG